MAKKQTREKKSGSRPTTRQDAQGWGQDTPQGEIAAPTGSQAPTGPLLDLPYIAPDLQGLAVPVGTLVPSPHNARRHGERDLQVLADSYARYGQRKPIVVRAGTNEVLAGNGQLQAAMRLGWTHIAASVFHGSDEDATEFALVDNQSALLSEWDLPVLSEQLRSLYARDAALPGVLGWDDVLLGPLLAANWTPPVEEPLPSNAHGADVTGGNDPLVQVMVTAAQYDVIRQAMDHVRLIESDPGIPEGRCLELIAAEFLSGL